MDKLNTESQIDTNTDNEPIYQHQEGPNEDYFECEAEYLDGTWCI